MLPSRSLCLCVCVCLGSWWESCSLKRMKNPCLPSFPARDNRAHLDLSRLGKLHPGCLQCCCCIIYALGSAGSRGFACRREGRPYIIQSKSQVSTYLSCRTQKAKKNGLSRERKREQEGADSHRPEIGAGPGWFWSKRGEPEVSEH